MQPEVMTVNSMIVMFGIEYDTNIRPLAPVLEGVQYKTAAEKTRTALTNLW
jgi:hypothetical protein